jgi:hypothetical protein
MSSFLFYEVFCDSRRESHESVVYTYIRTNVGTTVRSGRRRLLVLSYKTRRTHSLIACLLGHHGGMCHYEMQMDMINGRTINLMTRERARKMILHLDVSVHVLRFDVLIQVTTTGDGWAYELYVLEGGRLLFKQRFDSL